MSHPVIREPMRLVKCDTRPQRLSEHEPQPAPTVQLHVNTHLQKIYAYLSSDPVKLSRSGVHCTYEESYLAANSNGRKFLYCSKGLDVISLLVKY